MLLRTVSSFTAESAVTGCPWTAEPTIEMGFPYDMFAIEMARSLSFGGMWGRIDAR
jgi:hypothetical protein